MTRLTDAKLVALYNQVADDLQRRRVAFDYSTVIAAMAERTGATFAEIEDRLIDVTAAAAN
jgi:hypothetical protein